MNYDMVFSGYYFKNLYKLLVGNTIFTLVYCFKKTASQYNHINNDKLISMTPLTLRKLVLTQVSNDCSYLQTTIYLTVGDERFSSTGKTLIKAGFTEFMPWLAISTEENMPAFQKDDTYSIHEVSPG